MASSNLLIGDIGGTNARFALAHSDKPGFSDLATFQCADYASVERAIADYLQIVGKPCPDVICLAAAGPVVNQRIRMTNNHWTVAIDSLLREFPDARVRLLNDFEAIAYSVPFLSAGDCATIGLPDPAPLPDDGYSVAILGPGTGLGAVGLRKQADQLVPVPGEAGHVGFGPETQVQVDVLNALRERFDRVSRERLVSGPGLENIYWALGQIHGKQAPKLSAAEIFARAAEGGGPRAAEAVALFFEVLGQVAGDLALALGAQSGVYIAGGIVKRYPEMLESSRFRAGFERKGRYRSIMERIPTQLILLEQPGLLGAAYCALQLRSPAASR
jgi:glucokinase